MLVPHVSPAPNLATPSGLLNLLLAFKSNSDVLRQVVRISRELGEEPELRSCDKNFKLKVSTDGVLTYIELAM